MAQEYADTLITISLSVVLSVLTPAVVLSLRYSPKVNEFIEETEIKLD